MGDKVDRLRQMTAAILALEVAAQSGHAHVIDPDVRRAIIIERDRLHDAAKALHLSIRDAL